MKVLQLIDSLSAGGAERMAVNMANAFSNHCISNILCVTRSEGILKSFLEKEVTYYCLNKTHPLDAFAFARMLHIIRKHKPDIVHAHSSSYFWAVLAKLFFPGIIVIWHDHQGLKEKRKVNHRPLLKFLSRKIDGIIVVNEIIRQWNIRHTSLPEERIRFINNFPDPRITAKSNKSKNDITVLCLANLRPEKNHLMLIEAFHKVVKQVPHLNVRLWLAGNKGEGSPLKAINSLITGLQLQERVLLLGTVENTGELLANADIGVLSSVTEGLPVSLLEYGLAGLPVLVTQVGQCKEVLQDGKLGWLVPSRDVDRFAKTLLYIIQHPDKAIEKAKLLKDHISTTYGAKHFVSEYLAFSAQLFPERKVVFL